MLTDILFILVSKYILYYFINNFKPLLFKKHNILQEHLLKTKKIIEILDVKVNDN